MMTRRMLAVYGSLLLLIATAAPTGAADRSPVRNGRIFFSAPNPLLPLSGVDTDIFSVLPNGTGLLQETGGPELDSGPKSSPDGTLVVFDRAIGCACQLGSSETYPTTPRDIFVMNADGTDLVNLTGSPAVSDRGADWSPDGSQIAFSSGGYDGNSDELLQAALDIYVMDVASGDMRRIAQGSGWQLTPSWSPDGSWIVYEDVPTRSLRLVRSDGTRNKLLFTGFGRTPDWGPHGKIVFVQVGDSLLSGDIWVINADGTGLKNLTSKGAENNYGPAWSPDGRKIVFVSDRDGTNRLYIMDADGGNVRAVLDLTVDGAPLTSPSWAPR